MYQHSDTMELATFGDRLRDARREAKLTQQALSKRAGLSQSVISEIETGEYATSGQTAQLAAACGVRPLWLAEGRGPRYPEGPRQAGSDAASAPVLRPSFGRVSVSDGLMTEMEQEYTVVSEQDTVVSAPRRVMRITEDGQTVIKFCAGPSIVRSRVELEARGISNLSECVLVQMVGNALFPFVEPDKFVLVALDQTDVHRYNDLLWTRRVFAISQGGAIRLRILQVTANGSLRISAWNSTEYPSELIPPNELDTIKILGRMVDHA